MPRPVIVVPCYNEAQRLDVRAFERFAVESSAVDFLLVNDGSRDTTLELLEDLHQREPARFGFLHLAKNGGKAEAVRQGMLAAIAAGAPLVGFWDADLATPLGEIPRFCQILADHPELEMVVGYYGVVGVHDAPLAGNRRWGNRTLANVLSMAATGSDQAGRRRVFVADERGGLVPLDDQGRDGPPIVVNNRFIRSIVAADLDGDGGTEFCCLAPRQQAEDTAIGIDAVGRELWSYPLPKGVPAHRALEVVTAGNLLGAQAAQWILAGPDGSIHILAADGTAIDRFNYGSAITGIGVAPFDPPLLIVATAKGVEAWEVGRVK